MIGGQPPVWAELLAIIQTDGDIGVANVDAK